MVVPYKLVDDVELQFMSNHLGHFLLTSELLPLLTKTASRSHDVRIVNLSSLSHAWTSDKMDYASLESINSEWASPNERYGQSKAANVLFSKKLQEHIDSRATGDSGIFVNSAPRLCQYRTLQWDERDPKSVDLLWHD